MASPIRITANHLKDWREISHFSNDDLSKIIISLSKEDLVLQSGEQILVKLKSLVAEENKAKALLRQISAISDLSSFSGKELKTVVSDLFFTLDGELSSETEILQQLQSLRENILILLQDKNIVLFAKARKISMDHDSILLSTSTITDIRPVFREDRDEILGSIILTHLRINSLINGEQTTLSVVLDEVDIQKLIDQLESTQRKIAAASSAVENKLGVRAIMVGEEEIAYD